MLNLTAWIIVFTGLILVIHVQSDIIVHINCEDILNFYANGDDVNRNGETKSPNISIPDTTNVVAVACHQKEGPAGMKLTFSNGIKSDHLWRCYSHLVEGWHETSFNDDAWPNAIVIKGNWIWTAGYPQDDRVYCRRHIAITGLAACDNIMNLYVDGVEYKNGNASDWYEPSTIIIPEDTEVVGIKCRNTEGPAGIKLSLSNGIETSASWKCYNTPEEGWNEPEFNDANWPNAVVVRDGWIWTPGNPQEDIVYCRKVIIDRTGEMSTSTKAVEIPSSTEAGEMPSSTGAVIGVDVVICAIGIVLVFFCRAKDDN
ncbi:uncharacterized protein LOC130013972 [Patella vulgata]|uniref:uncharacterized protein LOC130013972 n=1 Tax=Patella vulgata TaxID=6465 RepID=UPI0024A83DEB|nr:uncharacterized protein LOC130013972 [Patella vulgata]